MRTYQQLESEKYMHSAKKEARTRAKNRPRKSIGDFNMILFGAFMVFALLLAADKIPPVYDWPFLRFFF